MCKYDVIYKTGSTKRIATPPEEDRAADIGNMHKIGEDRICSSGDMLTDKQTPSSQYFASLTGGEVTICMSCSNRDISYAVATTKKRKVCINCYAMSHPTVGKLVGLIG